MTNENRITTDRITTGSITGKQIDLSTGRIRPIRRSRGTLKDWLVAALAFLTFLLIVGIIAGGAFWLLLKIWTSALSMM